VSALGVVLGVWAHPDDETYLSAAHMMRAVAAGHRVACVTATRGELGSPDPQRWPPGPPLAQVRTRELELGLAELGVHDHTWLDYPDGGCAAVPLAEGAAHVLTAIDRVRPDTVLTFGPDGMTGHDDHISVSRWVDAAVATFDGQRPQVLWATQSPGWVAAWKERMDEVNVFMGSEPPQTPVEQMRSHVLLDDDERDRKVRALLQMTSQVGPLLQLFGQDGLRDAMTEECFR
jgi:LmbE family N-acetylglucosaminyl deacetylase